MDATGDFDAPSYHKKGTINNEKVVKRCVPKHKTPTLATRLATTPTVEDTDECLQRHFSEIALNCSRDDEPTATVARTANTVRESLPKLIIL